jgi:hypothetical protein
MRFTSSSPARFNSNGFVRGRSRFFIAEMLVQAKGPRYAARGFSIPRSGISQMSAAITRMSWAIQGGTRVAAIATAQSTGESLPFQSRPIAAFGMEFCPSARMIVCRDCKVQPEEERRLTGYPGIEIAKDYWSTRWVDTRALNM